MDAPIQLSHFCPIENDQTSFYRGKMVVDELTRQGICQTTRVERIDWRAAFGCDVFFLQRPAQLSHAQGALYLKSVGVPLWIDWDDDQFNVDPTSAVHRIFSNEEVHQSMRLVLKLADLITVSTPELIKVVERESGRKDAVCIPNAWPLHKFDFFPMVETPKRLFVWRGSKFTHTQDIRSFIPKIKNLCSSYQAKVVWCGMDEWEFLSLFPELTEVTEGVTCYDPIELLHVMQGLRPLALLVPLEDTPFNRSKSNIAEIEASVSGIPCIGPSWWSDSCLSWGDLTDPRYENVLLSPLRRKELIQIQRQHMPELVDTVRARGELIQKIVKSPRRRLELDACENLKSSIHAVTL